MAKRKAKQVIGRDDVRLRLVRAAGEGEALFAEGFDAAIVGWFQRVGRPAVVAYSYERCVAILVHRDGMTEADAEEFMEYNVVSAWVGEQTPAFVREVIPSERYDA